MVLGLFPSISFSEESGKLLLDFSDTGKNQLPPFSACHSWLSGNLRFARSSPVL